MALRDEFEHFAIKGKDVFVVQDHHRALAAWACIRRSLRHAPNLITIDHHTDTHEAFLGYACMEKYEHRVEDEQVLRQQLTAKIDWNSDASLLEAIEKLRHDEHINAATASGVVEHAFCIQLSDSSGYQSIEEEAFAANRHARWPNLPSLPVPTRPLTYLATEDRIYVIPAMCFVGCTAKPHNDVCLIRHANDIIEARYLEDQLSRGSEISACVGLANLEKAPYILDIDLDAFHSRKAITPDDSSTIYRLIKNAVAITIAIEEQCVKELWHDVNNQMNASDLLAELKRHIHQAL